jgi:hypothetical protein
MNTMKEYIVIVLSSISSISCNLKTVLSFPSQQRVSVDLGKINFMCDDVSFEGEFESAEHLPALPTFM